MSQAPKSVAKYAISHQAALTVVQAVIAKAKAMDLTMSVAVVDASARLVMFAKMDGAFLISEELAQKKARSAAGLGFTADIADNILAAEQPRVADGLLRTQDFILIRGGLPIFDGDKLIGAVGVSGGSEAQDVLCAEAGVLALA